MLVAGLYSIRRMAAKSLRLIPSRTYPNQGGVFIGSQTPCSLGRMCFSAWHALGPGSDGPPMARKHHCKGMFRSRCSAPVSFVIQCMSTTIVPMRIGAALSQKARGILLLIAAVSCFGAVDGFSKILVDTQSFGQIMLARYAPALAVLLVAVGPQRWKGLFATRRPVLQIVRGITPVCVGGLMVFAVRFLPLAEATVILFAGPFLVVAMSGVMLGERVDASSWIGVAIGFLAVLIVARPGIDALSQYTIFPALAAVFYALLQLLSRRLGAAGESPGTTLAWTLLVGSLVSLPVAIMDWRTPSPSDWFVFLCLGASFGWGQHFLARAFSLAPANVLTPFSYFQILSAAIFGVIAFQSIPDGWTVAGIALIFVAGAYVFGRSTPAKPDNQGTP